MKLLIAGSRSIVEFDLSWHIPEDVDLIISGGAVGIDTLAEQYADAHGIEKLIIRPEYEKFGRAAPIKRNEAMVDLCDAVLAVWDGSSRGTLSVIRYAEKTGKLCEVILCRQSPEVQCRLNKKREA